MKTILIKVNNIYTLMKGDKMFASSDLDFQIDYEVKKLSKENCDEIFGVVDLDELVDDYIIRRPFMRIDKKHQKMYKDGFNKAMELNKDKLFTVEDLIIAFFIGRESLDKAIVTVEEAREKIISSLYSPTEIEVEICCYIGNGDKESDSFKDPLVTNTGIPKLDENDCLILKKK